MAVTQPSPSRQIRRPRRGRVAALAAVLAVQAAGLGASALELRGTAVDEDGAPVAGARVELQAIPPRYEIGSRIVAGTLAGEPTAAVKTSGEGLYVLSVPEPGMWQVEVSAPGKIPARHRLVPLSEDLELPPAVLAADGGAWIAVVDTAGEPVAGALVWMRPTASADERRRRPPTEWQPRGRFSRTDEAGNVYLSRRRDQVIDVWAHARGFVPSESVTVAGDRGRVTLERGRPLEMRFVTAGGEPAAHAIVGVGALQWASDKTDHLGRARLFLRPDEPLPFSLHLPSGQRESGTLEASEDELDESASAGEAEVMTLPPPTLLNGRVLDAATGRPPADAWVWSAADPGRVVPADRAGGYRLVVSSAGYGQIGAAAPGYRPGQEHRGREDDGVGPTISLERAAAIAGRVVNAAGEGVAGAEISAIPVGQNPFWPTVSGRTTSRDDGRFRLAGLAAEASYEIAVRAAGFAPARRAARAELGVELEIVLEPGRSLVGRVVTTDGAPIAGAELAVVPSPQSIGSGRAFDSTSRQTTASAADGTFLFDELAPEQLLLVVRKKGFAPEHVPLVDLVTDPDEDAAAPLDIGEVVLDPGAGLAGVVRNQDDEPLAAVRVQIVGSQSGSALWFGPSPFEQPETPVTDVDGNFVLDGMKAGETLSLMFEHSEYLHKSVDGLVVGEEESIEVTLEKAARLSGRVEDEARRPVAGVMVRARPIGAGERGLSMAFGDATRNDSAPTDGEGRFALERVAPGTVELEATGAGYVAAGALEVELEPGELRDGVVLHVRRGIALEGTVRDTARRPVAGAILQVSEVEIEPLFNRSQGVATAQSDSNGRFLLEGLDPDAARLTLEVHHPEFLTEQRDLDLATAPGRLDLVLERGHLVSGVVLGPEGPVAGASVGLDGGSGVYFGGRETTISADDGSFEISGVGPGAYRLFAMKDGFSRSTSPEPVVVEDGPIAGLTLRLSRGGTIRGQLHGLEPEDLVAVQLMASDDAAQTAMGYVADDGSFTVPQVGFPKGSVSAWVQRDGRRASEGFTLDPEGGETWVELEFDAAGGSTLRGTILLDGEPWRQLQVIARGGLDSHGIGRTDSAGRFEIRGLAEGRYQILLVGGSVMTHSEVVDVAGDVDVTIEVSTVAVRGRVVIADTGQPAARAEVSAEGLGPEWMMGFSRVETTADGGFEFTLPANRQVTLRARAPGRGEAALVVDTGPGPVLEGLEIELGAGADIELEVRLASGFVPNWVVAQVIDQQGRRVGGRNLMGGGQMPLRIGSIPPGNWTLLVAGDGGAQVTLPVRVPGPPLSVILPPESRLAVDLTALADRIGNATLRLLDPTGAPALLASFQGHSSERPVFSRVTEVPSLPAGSWIVEITDDRGQTWHQPVTTLPGETASVVFE